MFVVFSVSLQPQVRNRNTIAFSGKARDYEPPEEKAVRRATGILEALLKAPLGNPETTYFTHTYRLPWFTRRPIVIPEMTVNSDVIVSYNKHPALDPDTQLRIFQAECERTRQPFDLKDFKYRPEAIERLYVTGHSGNSVRLVVEGDKITLDYDPNRGKLKKDLTLGEAERDLVKRVMTLIRESTAGIETRLKEQHLPVPKLGSFRDLVFPQILKNIIRGDVITAQRVTPNPFGDIATEERFEVEGKNKSGKPGGRFTIRRVIDKPTDRECWMIWDAQGNRSIQVRFAPGALGPLFIDKLSLQGGPQKPIPFKKAHQIPKREKLRRTGQRRQDKRLLNRFENFKRHLMSKLPTSE